MLKELRKNKGISMSFVAKKLGINRDTLRKLETGETMLRADWIPILSEIYGIKNEYILKGYLKEKEVNKSDESRN